MNILCFVNTIIEHDNTPSPVKFLYSSELRSELYKLKVKYLMRKPIYRFSRRKETSKMVSKKISLS